MPARRQDNFAADPEAAKRLIEAIPDVAAIARDNRSFLGRVVRYLAIEGGIRQFLGLGSVLLTQANVHELAQGVAPDARVVYVDSDPAVASHGRAPPAAGGEVGMVPGDLREPVGVLRRPDVACLLDLTQSLTVCAPAPLTTSTVWS